MAQVNDGDDDVQPPTLASSSSQLTRSEVKHILVVMKDFFDSTINYYGRMEEMIQNGTFNVFNTLE